MEEVIGSIPIRSTNKLPKMNKLSSDILPGILKFGSKLPKPLSEPDDAVRPFSPFFRPPADVFFAAILAFGFSDA